MYVLQFDESPLQQDITILSHLRDLLFVNGQSDVIRRFFDMRMVHQVVHISYKSAAKAQKHQNSEKAS